MNPTIKINTLFCLVCLLVCAAGVQAQPTKWAYPKFENGNTIVSRNGTSGIKEVAVLSTAQKTFLKNQSSQPIYSVSSEYNRVSAKLQVASTNASTGATWTNAYSLCKNYSQSGAAAGSWRLPTQRELMLIWIFKAKLTNANLPATGYFWTGTQSETSSASAWYMNFSDGSVNVDSKTSSTSVRCVRDL